MPGEIHSGDRERNAYPGLTVEVPRRGEGHERNGGEREAQEPGHEASRMRRPFPEAVAGEGEADDDCTVQRDEADGQRRHLTGQQAQEASRLARHALRPGPLVPHVTPHVHPVGHPDDSQVDPHDEVGHIEVQHKDDEALCLGHVLEEDAVDETAQVAQQRQHGEDGQGRPVDVGAEQRLAGRDLVGRSPAPSWVEASGQHVRAAQLVVVRVDSVQVFKTPEQIRWENGHWIATEINNLQHLQCLKAIYCHALYAILGQVQGPHVREDD